MKLYKRLYVLVAAMAIAALLIALCGSVYAEKTKNPVIPITPAELESMIQKRECPLLIVAMASWCAPCRAELPTLQKLHERYAGKGLKIIGVSLDVGGPSTVQPIVDQMNLTFPFYWGGEKVTTAYQISGIPLILVAKNGTVVEKILGKRPEKVLTNKVESLLKECEAKK